MTWCHIQRVYPERSCIGIVRWEEGYLCIEVYSDELPKPGWVVIARGLGITIGLQDWIGRHNLLKWKLFGFRNISYLIFQWNFFLCPLPRCGNHCKVGDHLNDHSWNISQINSTYIVLKANHRGPNQFELYLLCIFCLACSTFSSDQHWLVLTVCWKRLQTNQWRKWIKVLIRNEQPVFEHIPVGSLSNSPLVSNRMRFLAAHSGCKALPGVAVSLPFVSPEIKLAKLG